MKPFSLDEIRDVFRTDLEGFIDNTHRSLDRFLASDPPDPSTLELAAIQAHAMKGVASLVQAASLVEWGEDLEKLYLWMEASCQSDPGKARAAAHLLVDRLPLWRELAVETIEKNEEVTEFIRRRLHDTVRAHCPEAFVTPAFAAKSQPDASVAGIARRLPPPKLKVAKSEPPPPPEPVSLPPPASLASEGTLGKVGVARALPKPRFKVRREGPLVVPAAQPPADAERAGLAPEIEAMVREEISIYFDRLSTVLGKLFRDRNDSNAWRDVRRSFHTLYNSTGMLGLPDAQAICREAELVAEQAQDDASLQSSTATWEHAAQAVRSVAGILGVTFEIAQSKTAPAPSLPEDGPVDAELANAVAVDALEAVEQLEPAILKWERGVAVEEQRATAYRIFHTLKGASNSVGLRAMGAAMHQMEALLDQFDADRPAGEKFFQFLLRAADQIRRYAEGLQLDPKLAWGHDWREEIGRIGPGVGDSIFQAVSEEQAVPQTAPEGEAEFVRLDLSRLRKLLNQAGELVIERNRFSHKIDQAAALAGGFSTHRARLSELTEKFQEQFEFNSVNERARVLRGLPGARSEALDHAEFSELELDRYNDVNMLTRGLAEAVDDLGQLTTNLEQLLGSFRGDDSLFLQNSRNMQSDIHSLGMLPVSRLFQRAQRAFRDALQQENKQAELRFEGEQTVLDKSVIDRLQAPLLHLLRNAVAHGIETPAAREAAGKSPSGSVTLSARMVANQVVVSVADDGAGLDFDKIVARAEAEGWVEPGADVGTDQMIAWLFRPGFSTAGDVSSVRGRGIGLDVVREEIELMQGSVQVESRAGRGARWNLHLPLTLAVTEAVMVRVGESEFALPLNHIEQGIIVDEEQLRDQSGMLSMQFGSREIPAVRLGDFLNLARTKRAEIGPALIASVGDQRLLLLVDEVVGRLEVSMKPLDPILARHPVLEGGTLNLEGIPVLILNVPFIVRQAGESSPAGALPLRRAERETADYAPHVLVVDDSLSVRTVQQRLLTELGCKVALATDGIEAIEQLRRHEIDLVFTDLEMPRMNGFDLLSHLRADPAWSTLPVILITSRSGSKHVDKAFRLGASDYLPKPFGTGELIGMLEKHLRT